MKLMQQDVLRKMLEEKYQEGDPEFLDFISSYSGTRSDRRLEEWILKIYEFSGVIRMPRMASGLRAGVCGENAGGI